MLKSLAMNASLFANFLYSKLINKSILMPSEFLIKGQSVLIVYCTYYKNDPSNFEKIAENLSSFSLASASHILDWL